MRVNVDTPHILDEMAEELGCLRIDGGGYLCGSTGVLLDKIAKGEFIIKKVGNQSLTIQSPHRNQSPVTRTSVTSSRRSSGHTPRAT